MTILSLRNPAMKAIACRRRCRLAGDRTGSAPNHVRLDPRFVNRDRLGSNQCPLFCQTARAFFTSGCDWSLNHPERMTCLPDRLTHHGDRSPNAVCRHSTVKARIVRSGFEASRASNRLRLPESSGMPTHPSGPLADAGAFPLTDPGRRGDGNSEPPFRGTSGRPFDGHRARSLISMVLPTWSSIIERAQQFPRESPFLESTRAKHALARATRPASNGGCVRCRGWPYGTNVGTLRRDVRARGKNAAWSKGMALNGTEETLGGLIMRDGIRRQSVDLRRSARRASGRHELNREGRPRADHRRSHVLHVAIPGVMRIHALRPPFMHLTRARRHRWRASFIFQYAVVFRMLSFF